MCHNFIAIVPESSPSSILIVYAPRGACLLKMFSRSSIRNSLCCSPVIHPGNCSAGGSSAAQLRKKTCSEWWLKSNGIAPGENWPWAKPGQHMVWNGAGFVDSLARPGGNATGFMELEYSMGGKWLELLKQIAPSVTRAAVLRDPSQGSGTNQFAAIQAVATSLRVEVTPVGLRDTDEIERAVSAFARSPNGGLIVTAGAATVLHSNLIITLAARHKLPAVYNERSFAAAGGLVSYGPDFVDQYRRAAGYVDRILKGEKPANLPVQHPTKLDLVINLKTAKAFGIGVPPTLLARADEVIE
jgi:ABC transporter substrate binding protein